MRHGKKFNHLGRQKGHREAMLSNMATSLLIHKRIKTTEAKAKALRVFVEPIITSAKEDTTHNRRKVFRYLQDKEGVNELFRNVIQKVGDRPGGYTRIIKVDHRLGDGADMALIELVDYNELMLKDAKPAKAKTRRSRRGSGSEEATPAAATTETKVEEAPEVEAPKAEAPKADDAENTEEKE
jgi:large subunit ribosomal protein L17